MPSGIGPPRAGGLRLTAYGGLRMLRSMDRKDYRLAAIVYTNVAGFSKMMEKDEPGALELLDVQSRIVEGAVAAKGGTVIKTVGDATLLDFRNTVDALQCAMDIQARLYERNAEHPEFPVLLRVGIHLGDTYFYENDALGEGVNIANGLQAAARPGCICMSQDVYKLVLGKVDFSADALGPVRIGSSDKKVDAYEVASPNLQFLPRTEGDSRRSSGRESGGAGTGGAAASGPEASALRRRILLDVKAAGRRLGVREALARYGDRGAVAAAVVEDLAAKGILVRDDEADNRHGRSSEGAASFFGAGGQAAGPQRFTKVINDLEYLIEDEVRAAIERRRGRSGRDSSRDGGAENASAAEPAYGARSREYRSGLREERHELRRDRRSRRREERHGTSEEGKDGKWEDKLGTSHFRSAADSLTDYDLYAEKVRTEARRGRSGFVGHLVTYALVNGFLMSLNASVSPGFPWAIFPLGGWGIGLLEHLASVLRKSDRAKELERLPPLDPERLGLFKKLQKLKDSIWLHFASTVSTGAFLIGINLLLSPSVPWGFFVAGAMVIGFFSHLASNGQKRRDLERKLVESFGMEGSWSRALRRMPKTLEREWSDLGPYRELVDEAANARAAIAAQLGVPAKKGKKGRSGSGAESSLGMDADMLPALDSYVDQVASMARRAVEADRIIELIPMDALAADKAALRRKLDEAPGESLKREYAKSLEEIGKQERSYEELVEQREILELRMRSSVNTLKQMRIDVARLSGMDAGGETGSSRFVREKTEELNRYLQDLKSGYEELDRLEEESFPLSDDPDLS